MIIIIPRFVLYTAGNKYNIIKAVKLLAFSDTLER